MSTTTITNKVTDSSGNPLVGVAVRITLETNTAGQNIPGVGSASSVTQPVTTTTDATGTWTVGLVPNSQITQPANTYYQVSEGGYLSNIIVPAAGGPYELAQVQTGSAPTPATQYALAPAEVSVAASGTVAGLRPEVNLIPGTNMTVTAVDNPGANRVDVTLTSTAGGAGPSSTVVTETSYGQASAAGSASTFSRGDHTHGSPATPTVAVAHAGTVAGTRSEINFIDGSNVTVAVADNAGAGRVDVTVNAATPTAPQFLYPFSKAGTVAVAVGQARIYNDSGRALTIQGVRASVGTAPTGATLIVDVKKNGTTIFTTQANRPTIAINGNTSGFVTNMDVTALANGDYLTVDVAQVGSTVAGSDLTVTIVAD